MLKELLLSLPVLFGVFVVGSSNTLDPQQNIETNEITIVDRDIPSYPWASFGEYAYIQYPDNFSSYLFDGDTSRQFGLHGYGEVINFFNALGGGYNEYNHYAGGGSVFTLVYQQPNTSYWCRFDFMLITGEYEYDPNDEPIVTTLYAPSLAFFNSKQNALDFYNRVDLSIEFFNNVAKPYFFKSFDINWCCDIGFFSSLDNYYSVKNAFFLTDNRLFPYGINIFAARDLFTNTPLDADYLDIVYLSDLRNPYNYDLYFNISQHITFDNYQTGYNEGYDTGYQIGYDTGLNSQHDGLLSLFFAIADTPILMLRSLFDFNILGMSVLGLLLGLVTIIIVLFIVRKLI